MKLFADLEAVSVGADEVEVREVLVAPDPGATVKRDVYDLLVVHRMSEMTGRLCSEL